MTSTDARILIQFNSMACSNQERALPDDSDWWRNVYPIQKRAIGKSMNRPDVRIGLKDNCTQPGRLVSTLTSIISIDSGNAIRESGGHSRNPLITESSCLRHNEDCERGNNSESSGWLCLRTEKKSTQHLHSSETQSWKSRAVVNLIQTQSISLTCSSAVLSQRFWSDLKFTSNRIPMAKYSLKMMDLRKNKHPTHHNLRRWTNCSGFAFPNHSLSNICLAFMIDHSPSYEIARDVAL
jgi:hypothetical protein